MSEERIGEFKESSITTFETKMERENRRENGEEIFDVIEVEKFSILMTVNYELALAVYLSKDRIKWGCSW